MNQFFLYWVDLFAMVSSLIIAVVLTFKTIKRTFKSLRPLAVFFSLFGPVVIAVHMALHLFEIGYHAGQSIAAGSFVYNFRFYSLVLMGVLIGWLSLRFLSQCTGYISFSTVTYKKILQTMGIIALVSVPTVPFTPIGSLPLMACLISLVALRFVHKQQQQSVIMPMEETAAISAQKEFEKFSTVKKAMASSSSI